MISSGLKVAAGIIPRPLVTTTCFDGSTVIAPLSCSLCLSPQRLSFSSLVSSRWPAWSSGGSIAVGSSRARVPQFEGLTCCGTGLQRELLADPPGMLSFWSAPPAGLAHR